jgi:two-component system response regulator HupR/HoxA
LRPCSDKLRGEVGMNWEKFLNFRVTKALKLFLEQSLNASFVFCDQEGVVYFPTEVSPVKVELNKTGYYQTQNPISYISHPISYFEKRIGGVCVFSCHNDTQSLSNFWNCAEITKKLIEILMVEILASYSEYAKFQEEKALQEIARLSSVDYFYESLKDSKKLAPIALLIERFKDADPTVLITGQNGTGKELVARALHQHSKRRKDPFLAVNCGALNEQLLESELFGHIKGSFTGAYKDKKGIINASGEGTLFLDEIGELSLAMQVKLLRFLQSKSYIPVGGITEEFSQARILCATNRDLEKMVAEGLFREDLFYRINVISIHLPSLAERAEDIPKIVSYLLAKYCLKHSLKMKTLTKDTLDCLVNYSWPGNIRELENEIERIGLLTGDESEVTQEYLSDKLVNLRNIAPVAELGLLSLNELMGRFEREILLKAMTESHNNQTKAAKNLKISRTSLIAKLKKYQL